MPSVVLRRANQLLLLLVVVLLGPTSFRTLPVVLWRRPNQLLLLLLLRQPAAHQEAWIRQVPLVLAMLSVPVMLPTLLLLSRSGRHHPTRLTLPPVLLLLLLLVLLRAAAHRPSRWSEGALLTTFDIPPCSSSSRRTRSPTAQGPFPSSSSSSSLEPRRIICWAKSGWWGFGTP
jgi:hypothetical protein